MKLWRNESENKWHVSECHPYLHDAAKALISAVSAQDRITVSEESAICPPSEIEKWKELNWLEWAGATPEPVIVPILDLTKEEVEFIFDTIEDTVPFMKPTEPQTSILDKLDTALKESS